MATTVTATTGAATATPNVTTGAMAAITGMAAAVRISTQGDGT
ncbi:MAG: hypothetical protein ACYCUI_16045 [Vulcanimicrobiaceae bacterium]